MLDSRRGVWRLLARHRDGRAVDGGGVERAAHPFGVTADGGYLVEEMVDVAGDHGVLDPPDYLHVLHFEAQQDIAAEVTPEDVALSIAKGKRRIQQAAEREN